MKHDEVVAALTKIAGNGFDNGIPKADLEELRSYTLIEITPPDSKSKKTTYTLTKKGRVMLKANLKP